MASRNRMEINIFGQSYVLHSTREEEDMRKVVSLATKTIQEAASQQTRYNTTLQATLACMNLADACIQAQEQEKAAEKRLIKAQEKEEEARKAMEKCQEENLALKAAIQQSKRTSGARPAPPKSKGTTGTKR